MGRISGIDAIKEVMDKYSSSSADFFGLKEDGETAKVRFNHGDDKDLDIFVVHKVTLAAKDRYVECLSANGQPCPFCQAGLRPQVRIFLTLKDGRDGKLKLWDRGKNEISNIVGLVTRYGRLDGRTFDIVRHGKKGDPKTTYQFFPDDPSASDLEKREDILGPDKFILQKSPEEMKNMLNEIDVNAGGQTNYTQQNNGGQAGKKMF